MEMRENTQTPENEAQANLLSLEVDKTVQQSVALNRASMSLQNGVKGFYQRLGRSGQFIQNILNGTWLGHPLHPVLVDIPVGSWTVMVLLDLLESATGRKRFGESADVAGVIGTTAAAGAALAGLTDWQHTSGQARRIGFVHGILNTLALGLIGGSLAARKGGRRSLGRGLGWVGYLVVIVSSYLGGDLVFRQRVGVKKGPIRDKSADFRPTVNENELAEGEMKRVAVDGVDVLLARVNGQVYAMADTCGHMGCSLSQGRLNPDLTVVCACHGSRFDLPSGRVIDGPSAYSQVHYDTQISAQGSIEVRRRS